MVDHVDLSAVADHADDRGVLVQHVRKAGQVPLEIAQRVVQPQSIVESAAHDGLVLVVPLRPDRQVGVFRVPAAQVLAGLEETQQIFRRVETHRPGVGSPQKRRLATQLPRPAVLDVDFRLREQRSFAEPLLAHFIGAGEGRVVRIEDPLMEQGEVLEPFLLARSVAELGVPVVLPQRQGALFGVAVQPESPAEHSRDHVRVGVVFCSLLVGDVGGAVLLRPQRPSGDHIVVCFDSIRNSLQTIRVPRGGIALLLLFRRRPRRRGQESGPPQGMVAPRAEIFVRQVPTQILAAQSGLSPIPLFEQRSVRNPGQSRVILLDVLLQRRGDLSRTVARQQAVDLRVLSRRARTPVPKICRLLGKKPVIPRWTSTQSLIYHGRETKSKTKILVIENVPWLS